MKEENKQIKNINEEVKMEDNRSELNLQQFMNDMRMLGDQVRSKDLAKPNFNYGDISVTNYLLWLLLGEIMMLNDKLDEE